MDDTPTNQGEQAPATPGSPVTTEPGQGRVARKAAASSTGPGRPSWVVVLVIAVLAVITLVGVTIAYRSFSARVEASRKIDEAKTLIERADEVVVQVDGVVLEEVTPELADQAEAAQRKIGRAKADLTKATELLEEARPDATERDRELVGLLTETAESRSEMLVAAEKILPLNVAASRALDPARKGWDALLAADKASDKAVASYNKLTKASVTESSRLNKQAASLLATAQTEFAAAEQVFSAAPFEKYQSYVQTRQKLNGLSRQSDAAWLKGDIAKANQLIKQYNEGDKRSVALAKTLPDAPEKSIADTYGELAAKPTDEYYAARERATTADERLEKF